MRSTATEPIENRYQIAYKPLDQVLNPQITGLSRVAVEELLCISSSQLRKDTELLLYVKPIGFIHQPRAKGYLRTAIEVLWEFRWLVKVFGRPLAIQSVNSHMEKIYEQRRQAGIGTEESTSEPTKWAIPTEP